MPGKRSDFTAAGASGKPAASRSVRSDAGSARSSRHSAPRPPARSNASRQAGHHGVACEPIGSTTSTIAPRAAASISASSSGRRSISRSSLIDQAAMTPVRSGARPRVRRDANAPRSPRVVRPARPSVRHVHAASVRGQPSVSTPAIAAGSGSASAHAADATPVPQPRSTIVSSGRSAGRGGFHERVDGEEVQRRVVSGERRALAGGVERRALGQTPRCST